MEDVRKHHRWEIAYKLLSCLFVLIIPQSEIHAGTCSPVLDHVVPDIGPEEAFDWLQLVPPLAGRSAAA